MKKSYFTYEGINFYYEDDENDGYPFLFMHGLGGSTDQTMSVIKSTPRIRRITFDFRGHGKTIQIGNPSKLSFEQFSKDAMALLQHLKIKRANIGGISTGAGVALHLTLRNPEIVNKLVLSRPAWEDGPQTPRIQEAFATIYKILADDSVSDKKGAYQQTTIYNTMNNISKYASGTLLGQFDYLYAIETAEKLDRIPKDAPNYDRNEWKTIISETLILVAKNDPIHPYEYGYLLNQYIPNSKLTEITSKDISSNQHNIDSNKSIQEFLD